MGSLGITLRMLRILSFVPPVWNRTAGPASKLNGVLHMSASASSLVRSSSKTKLAGLVLVQSSRFGDPRRGP